MATPETRPAELANTWAETGTVADLGDIATGWPAGKPGRGRMNQLFGWLMQGVRYFLHRGVPDYSSSCTYAVGDRAQGSDGKTYVCIQANTPSAAQDPTSQAAYWVRWGFAASEAGGALASGTITPSGSSTVSYYRRLNFPLTTDALVCCRLNLHHEVDGFETTLTLSGAAAFAAGADGAVATLADANGDDVTSASSVVSAKILTATTVQVTCTGATGTNNLIVEVQIRGH